MLDSFSQDTKNEICAAKNKFKCCRKAELYGMLFGASIFEADKIYFDVENPTVFIHYTKLIHELVKLKNVSDSDLSFISTPELFNSVISPLELKNDSYDAVDKSVMSCTGCGWAFVRGVFLSCGTITAPDNAYHLEFLLRNHSAANSFMCFLNELGFSPKITERGEELRGVYFKDSEGIVDILGHIGANRAAFDILNVKIYKDIRNNANRVSNCELANLEKTINASNEQINAITKIIEAGKADELPDELKMTLDIRAAFPDASLSELAAKHTPPITKSGVNHRLKKLLLFAEKI